MIFGHLSWEEYVNYLHGVRLSEDFLRMSQDAEDALIWKEVNLLRSLNFGNEDDKQVWFQTASRIRRMLRVILCANVSVGLFAANPSSVAAEIVHLVERFANENHNVIMSAFTSISNFAEIYGHFDKEWTKNHFIELVFGVAFNGNKESLIRLLAGRDTQEIRRIFHSFDVMPSVLGRNSATLPVLRELMQYSPIRWKKYLVESLIKCDYKDDEMIVDVTKDKTGFWWRIALEWGSAQIMTALIKKLDYAGAFHIVPSVILSNNNIKLLRFLLSIKTRNFSLFGFDTQTVQRAAELGRIEIINYLFSCENGKPIFEKAFDKSFLQRAISYVRSPDYVKFIKSLLEANLSLKQLVLPGFTFNSDILDLACKLKDVELLEFLYEGKVAGKAAFREIDFAAKKSKYISLAAELGNLAFIHFYYEKHKKGCSFFQNVRFDTTTYNNHRNIVKYSIISGNVELVEFIYNKMAENDPAFESLVFDSSAIEIACGQESLDLFKFLHAKILSNDPLFIKVETSIKALHNAVIKDRLSVVESFYKAMSSGQPGFEKVEFTSNLVDLACRKHSVSVFKFLCDKISEGDSLFKKVAVNDRILVSAIEGDSLPIFDFIIDGIRNSNHAFRNIE